MKGRNRCLKMKVYIALILMLIGITGCNVISKKEARIIRSENKIQSYKPNVEEDVEITAICEELYEKAVAEKKEADLEMIRSIVKRFGEKGYPAVDCKNQINMVEADQVVSFCEQTEAKKEAELTIIEVNYLGGFVKYDLQTKDGKVDVNRSSYEYENGKMQRKVTERYQAEEWKYTKEGYLMFSGTCFSKEEYVLTLSEVEEHAAFRVQPLDETYRELNRKYLMPISYALNNMFLTDWSEGEFGELNFYDMYDIFYSKVNVTSSPYVADDNLGVGAIYQIPKEEFERVIMTYFNIDSETLQSKTTYHAEGATYEYKPRGFYEVEYPEYPYPEVVGFTQNSDGTIKLMVHAVFPNAGLSKAYAHEVVVRPLEDGGIQYVSNHVIPSGDNYEETWYTSRLTDKEWEELYGKEDAKQETSTESTYWFIPQSDTCLISEEEKEQLKKEALTAAEQVSVIYKNVKVVDELEVSSGMSEFTAEHQKAVVKELGKNGFISVAEGVNMENYEILETFYADYLKGKDAKVTIFEVLRDGLIGATTFIYRQGELQTHYVGIRWKEGGIPEIQGTSVSDVAEIKLTKKGYFIYAYEEVLAHASMRQYFRTKPLSDKCRELTAKYISGLSYVNYNMLVTNWDSSNVEEILMPCMFEDIYRIYTGENLQVENREIPAEQYEQIMTTCFPVSIEQLRRNCGYIESSNSYPYEMIYARPYPPFGEVVDYTKNVDGTITLIVDGVWADYNSDCAFTNRIVVQPFADGTFRYLSNSIEQKELELPEIESTKAEQLDKGYDLPVDERESEEAQKDCMKLMSRIFDIYKYADKGEASNVVLTDEVVLKMQNEIKDYGCPVTTKVLYSNMENYEMVDSFLKECMKGKSGSIVVYEVHYDGGIGRMKYIFDGIDMYVISTKAVWNDDNKPEMTFISHTRMNEWRYSKKGWFCYELCTPQPPQVSEIADGSRLIRIKPMGEEQRKLSKSCVQGLGYQGNNLLCSNWDIEHMEDLDYNGLFEYLYEMKYEQKFHAKNYQEGIPKDEFESLIMEYLPITAEQIREYAVFDEENQTYAWAGLGCFTYAPTFFGTSLPEVTDIRENEDGTVTLTVEAVCDMVLCDDAVITHELTMQFLEDGNFKYLGNKILDNGIERIPDYQYRIHEEEK